MENVPLDVFSILQEIAKSEGIPNSSFTFHQANRNEDGYLGKLYFVTIQDEESEGKREVVVKRAIEDDAVRANFPLEKVYSNECYFYENVLPIMIDELLFDKRPDFYGYDLTYKQEKLVLENLKFENFEVMNKRSFYNKEHLELILTGYGRFHGISMAHKMMFPEAFKMVTEKLYDYWSDLDKMPILKQSIELTMQECYGYLASESKTEQMAVFKKYTENGVEEFAKSTKYSGNHSVVLHGDCWSNNIMLKYDEVYKKPIDVRFIDFQLARLGTPIFDLSYFIYSGGNAEIFRNLDYYLAIYHKTLSITLARLQSNPRTTYSLAMLKEEWRMYCKFGFVMGLLLLKAKFVYENEGMAMAEIVENAATMKEAEQGKYDKAEVKKRSLDLIEHMFVCGLL